MRRLLFAIFHLTIAVSFAQTDNLKSYFPSESGNFYFPVLQYLEEKEIADITEIRDDLIYILSFLKDAIQAHETNIDNQISKSTLICLSPKLVNGELVISEVEKKIYSFDDVIKEYVFIPNFDMFTELVRFLEGVYTYNTLLDLWFIRTDEILVEKMDYDQKTIPVISKVINEANRY